MLTVPITINPENSCCGIPTRVHPHLPGLTLNQYTTWLVYWWSLHPCSKIDYHNLNTLVTEKQVNAVAVQNYLAGIKEVKWLMVSMCTKSIATYVANISTSGFCHLTIGVVLNIICVREKMHDRYAVEVLEEETCCVVGHLPREVSCECKFLKHVKDDRHGSYRQNVGVPLSQ